MAAKKYPMVDRKVSDLIVNNSRIHSEEQVIQICSSIKEFGFTNPVLIDEEKCGTLTDAVKVKQEAFKAGRIIRDELLAIPDRMADVLAAEDDPRKVGELLQEELEAILNAMASP